MHTFCHKWLVTYYSQYFHWAKNPFDELIFAQLLNNFLSFYGRLNVPCHLHNMWLRYLVQMDAFCLKKNEKFWGPGKLPSSEMLTLAVVYTQCGPKVLGLIFLKIEDTWGRHTFFKFKISSIGIYTGFCAVVQFMKSCRKFLFLDLL
jgi:hypothetical protein